MARPSRPHCAGSAGAFTEIQAVAPKILLTIQVEPFAARCALTTTTKLTPIGATRPANLRAKIPRSRLSAVNDRIHTDAMAATDNATIKQYLDIEVYESNDVHLGSMDPVTGEMHKLAVPGRTR